jgi:hypothetical protein
MGAILAVVYAEAISESAILDSISKHFPIFFADLF